MPSSTTSYITTPLTSATQCYHLIHQLNTINTIHKHQDHHTTLQKQTKTHPYSPWIHLSIIINNNKHNHDINAITNTSLYQQLLQQNHANITSILYLFTHFTYVFIYACPFTHFIYAYVYTRAFTHLVHRHQLQQKEQQHSYLSLTHCSIDTQQQHIIQSTLILHQILPTIQQHYPQCIIVHPYLQHIFISIFQTQLPHHQQYKTTHKHHHQHHHPHPYQELIDQRTQSHLSTLST